MTRSRSLITISLKAEVTREKIMNEFARSPLNFKLITDHVIPYTCRILTLMLKNKFSKSFSERLLMVKANILYKLLCYTSAVGIK